MRQLIPACLIAAACLGCDPLANPVNGPVSFSSDTISFDTVFTSVGSVTMEFRAVNRGTDPLLIDRIWLGGGSSSPFRLNINGIPGTGSENIILARGDSLFVFVEVTIDPTGETNPIAVIDSVVFASGRYVGRVILEAWGQDIWLIGDEITGTATWTEGKPYVIKESLMVDTLATLTLGQGTRVFFHYGALMTVAGSLITEGTAEKPVLFATDRLEDVYKDVPGRWKGIRFLDCSHNNIMRNTTVRNAEISVDINGSSVYTPRLELTGTSLMHSSVAALTASGSDIMALNCIFAHTGFSTVHLTGGGNYEFIHCTMANRWEYGFRSEPVMLISRREGMLPNVSLVNTVITGSLNNELFVDANPGEMTGKLYADSSLIRVDTTGSKWFQGVIFRDVQTSPLPRFIAESDYDYRPDTLSPLIDRAGISESRTWPYDIRHKPRPVGNGSDIGAYERQPGEKKKER